MDLVKLFNNFIQCCKNDNLVVNYAAISEDEDIIASYDRLSVRTRLNTWSACKGVVSCACGIALDDDLISLDEKIVDLFPKYACKNKSKYINDVKLEHLLTMSSGLEEALFFCDNKERYITDDWIDYFFTHANIVNKPGSTWLYSNFNTYLLSCVIEQRAKCNLIEYLRKRFFKPLGIGNPDWTLCPHGHVHAANGLYVNIDEFVNYNQMILHKGKFKNNQIVPLEYMKIATKKHIDNACAKNTESSYEGFGYGYQFMINPIDGYRSDGNYGQFAVCLPQQDIAISVLSLDSNFRKIGNHLYSQIVDKMY